MIVMSAQEICMSVTVVTAAAVGTRRCAGSAGSGRRGTHRRVRRPWDDRGGHLRDEGRQRSSGDRAKSGTAERTQIRQANVAAGRGHPPRVRAFHREVVEVERETTMKPR